MSYSSLKRKTPLRSRGKLSRKQPLERKPQSERRSTERAPRKSGKSSLETHLDIVFSIFIRLRDAMDGGMTRCISCGRVLPFSQMQCGHFFSRSNLSTRWDELNCNAECARCNCFDDKHLVGYERNLVAKIGQGRFDELSARARGMRKWGGDELREMIRHYTAEARRLSKEKGISVRI